MQPTSLSQPSDGAPSSPQPQVPSMRTSFKGQLFAGATAGLISCVALQPFEVIKTRLQVAPTGTSWLHRLGFIHRDIQSAMDAHGAGGWGMWRGTAASIMRGMPFVAVYFASIDTIRHKMANSERFTEVPELTRDLMAGGIARALAVLLLMPFSVAKTRIESGLLPNAHSVTTLQALCDVTSQRGIMGLWTGWGATLARDVPAGAMYVALYEAQKRAMRDYFTALSEFEIRSLSAICAATATVIATQPIDVLKSKIQTNPAENRNIFVAAIRLLREDGLRGFSNGLGPRALRKSFQAVLTWGIYEKFSDFIDYWYRPPRKRFSK